MATEKETLYMVRGMIASQSQEDKAKIHAAEQEIRAVIAKYPEGHASMAVALLGAEMAAAD